MMSDLGDRDQADLLAAMSEEHAPSEGVATQALWRCARARVMAGRNGEMGAEHLVREALVAVSDEMPNLRADVLMDLAWVLHRLGDDVSAGGAKAQAIALYEGKGNTVSAARAHAELS
jgi:hypothetical protein